LCSEAAVSTYFDAVNLSAGNEAIDSSSGHVKIVGNFVRCIKARYFHKVSYLMGLCIRMTVNLASVRVKPATFATSVTAKG
jgi:hypothetical protein